MLGARRGQVPHLLSCAHGLKQCLPPLLPAPTPLAALRPGTPEHWWTHGPALQGWEDSELQELEPCNTCTGGHSSVTLLAWLAPYHHARSMPRLPEGIVVQAFVCRKCMNPSTIMPYRDRCSQRATKRRCVVAFACWRQHVRMKGRKRSAYARPLSYACT